MFPFMITDLLVLTYSERHWSEGPEGSLIGMPLREEPHRGTDSWPILLESLNQHRDRGEGEPAK